MKINIAKEFNWEMSHRLPFHDGPCNNIHGHTYKMRIELEGETNKRGMVLDYYEIEKIASSFVKKLDHSFICDAGDSLMIDFLKKNGFRHFIIPDYTTAENIAAFFSRRFSSEFSKFPNLEKMTVRVFETEDVFAEIMTVLND